MALFLQAMDSESKDSLIGSFLQPPAKMIPAPFVCGEPKKLAAAGDNGPSICYNQSKPKIGLFICSLWNLLSKVSILFYPVQWLAAIISQ